MREHRYSFEMPHAAARIWALFQDYDRWPDYAPMVERVDVLWPGDADHNGRLRRVIYQMPFGRRGSALELVSDVEPGRGYTYTMISSKPGNDQVGHIRLEPLGPNRHALRVRRALQPGVGPVPLVRGSDLLLHQQEERGEHAPGVRLARPSTPEYRPDLIDRSV